MTSSSASPEETAVSAYSRCSGVRSVPSSSSVMPITPLSGVRISWLMLARNSDFEREASTRLAEREAQVGDVGGHHGDGVGLALAAEQRELDDVVDPLAVADPHLALLLVTRRERATSASVARRGVATAGPNRSASVRPSASCSLRPSTSTQRRLTSR